jgi:hypothetical protein
MKKFEEFIGKYKNTINFFGIIIALGALIYSGINTKLTYKALTSDINEYKEKNTPLFDFSISRIDNKISSESISIKPINQDISLNKVYFFFFNKNKKDTFEILIPENYKLKDFKSRIEKELKDYSCDDCFAYSQFTCIPIGVKFEYFQFGMRKELLGFFKLTCKIHVGAGNFGTSLRHIEFLKYYQDNNKLNLWNDIELFAFKNCYKKSAEHILIEQKKIEIIKNDKKIKPAYELIRILSQYYNYRIIYEPIDSIQEYQFNYFLGNDSLKSDYLNIINNSPKTYNNLKLKTKKVEKNI